MPLNRRDFITLAPLVFAYPAAGGVMAATESSKSQLSISLAQWSLNRRFFGKAREAGFAEIVRLMTTDPDQVLQGADPLAFPQIARDEFGINAVEYVNTFYFSRAKDEAYLATLKQRAEDAGVASRLIMCDWLGQLGAADAAERLAAVELHRPWLSAAEQLGCHAIRVNLYGEGDNADMGKACIESLSRLGEIAGQHGLNVLVENHGGVSSDAAWLMEVISSVQRDNVGTLPDFGNFRLLPNTTPRTPDDPHYDRYQGVAELLPAAKAVSAKSYAFDEAGEETTIDYARMFKLIGQSGYQGDIGIEYEGSQLDEHDGILATKALIERYI